MAGDTKLGPEEITRDIPNVGEENLKNLDEAGIVYIGAEVNAGRHPGRQGDAERRDPDDAGREAAARHLRREGGRPCATPRFAFRRASPARSSNVRVFNRHGVGQGPARHDDREGGRGPSGRGPRRRARDPGAQHVHAPSRTCCCTRPRRVGPKGMAADTKITQAVLDTIPRHSGGRSRCATRRRWARSKRCASSTTSPSSARQALRRQGREAEARRRAGARRDEDGQGVRRGEAQAAARRQDGPAVTATGRHQAASCRWRHAASGRRHGGRRRAQSARRAVAHERRTDPWRRIWAGPAPASAARSGDVLDKVNRDGQARTAAPRAQARLWRRRTAQGTRRQGHGGTRR